jgi:leucyl aminopeptidase
MYIPFKLLTSLLPFSLNSPNPSQPGQPKSLLSSNLASEHPIHPSIHQALSQHPADPVQALLSLRPELAGQLAEPRLLQVFGEEPVWAEEGDKLRLRREGKGFMDVTENWELYQKVKQSGKLMAGKARKSD